VPRIVEDVPNIRAFYDPPEVHDHDIVGHLGDDPEVVGDKEDGRIKLPTKGVHQAQYLA